MDKKTIMAFVIIGAIIILMPYYYKMTTPESARKPAGITSLQTAADSVETPAESIETTREDSERIKLQKQIEELKAQLASGTTVEDSVIPSAETSWQENEVKNYQTFQVETPLYIAKFRSLGATLISFKLKEFDDRRGGMTEMMLSRRDGDAYPNAFMKFHRMDFSTADLYFTSSMENLNLDAGEEGEFVFTADLKNGGQIKSIYNFNGDDYVINLHHLSENVNLDDEYYFGWEGGVNVTEPDTLQDLSYSKSYAMMGGELETLDAPGKGEKKLSPTGKVAFAAVRSKYFEIGIIPEGNTSGIDFVGRRLGSGKTSPKEFQLAIKMNNPGRNIDQRYKLFIGPMNSKRLAKFGVGLEATMNWGMSIIKPFSKLVLWTFKLLHKVIPNYGWVIIVFSILIKVILWPLTHKSYVSMRKMSTLQPMMKEIKEKYKGDPQKIQKATAALYKEHKVNPLGGCLPTMLQMPLLFGLFIVFRSTIELRGAPFMLWIKDLSLPDTIINLGFTIPMYGSQISVLPLLMGASTYYQSKMTMTDPNQKMMLYFMPVFLVLMFNSFPSGLTLYYTLFNVLSVVQQKMVPMGKNEPVLVAAKKK